MPQSCHYMLLIQFKWTANNFQRTTTIKCVFLQRIDGGSTHLLKRMNVSRHLSTGQLTLPLNEFSSRDNNNNPVKFSLTYASLVEIVSLFFGEVKWKRDVFSFILVPTCFVLHACVLASSLTSRSVQSRSSILHTPHHPRRQLDETSPALPTVKKRVDLCICLMHKPYVLSASHENGIQII